MKCRPRRSTISRTNLIRRGVPKRFHDFTIEDLDDFGLQDRAKIIDFIKDYITNLNEEFNRGEGLFIYGSNGTGKSTIGSLIVKEAYIGRYTSRRVTLVDYMERYTKAWNCKDYDEKVVLQREFIEQYKGVEFLVLEEIGKEVDSKLAITVIEDLLRYREDNGLPTIICTNMTPKNVAEKYGASVMSLIKGNTKSIKLVGVDRRVD